MTSLDLFIIDMYSNRQHIEPKHDSHENSENRVTKRRNASILPFCPNYIYIELCDMLSRMRNNDFYATFVEMLLHEFMPFNISRMHRLL